LGPAIETFSRSIASVRTATLRATAKEAEKTNGRVLTADRAETQAAESRSDPVIRR